MDCPPRQKKVVVVEEVKGFATSLSLKVRIFGTRPVWPIFLPPYCILTRSRDLGTRGKK